MAVVVKLKHVDELSGGRKRFRRRYPKAVAEALGDDFFQVSMQSRDGADLFTEHARLISEYDKIVAKALRTAAERGQLSPLQHWREVIKEAEALVTGVIGARGEGDARQIVADELERLGADPVLYTAVVSPDAEEPPITMADAKEMYRVERMAGATGRNQKNRLDRVCGRIEASLGPLNKLALVDLKREHARKLRDDMLSTKKKDGSALSRATVIRELDMIRAMITTAIAEHDLKGKAHNPFDGLGLNKGDAAPDTEWDKRDPLPSDIILAMRQRMNGNLRQPALGIIWRLLEGTGCRGAEVIGLRTEDVHTDGPYPYIRVMWHEDRRVKSKQSIRSVPLVGDALRAAKEAMALAGKERMLFPGYAHEGGPDAVSQALMKHLRRFTTNKRHVVYSLRHNMKDLLVTAGVPERDEHRILGHSLGEVGNRVYGGDEAKLKVATEAMVKAHALMP
jgi:integrase